MNRPGPKPPRSARRFFRWYCNTDLQESIEGDLEERFEDNLLRHSVFRSKVKYWLDVLRFMNKYTLRKKERTPGTVFTSSVHSIKHSIRFLARHKQYTFINLFGLSIGLAATLLIGLFLQHELSYDQFFDKSDRVYRINNIYWSESGNSTSLANSSPAFAIEFPAALPAYEKATRLRYAMRTLMSQEDVSFYEDGGFYADSAFFEVLSYELMAGDPATVLDEPNSLVITEAMALRYFGRTRPLGEFITINGSRPLEVKGILAPLPDNAHLQFDFLISFSTYEIPEGYVSDLTSWSWGGFLTYVRLAEGTDPNTLTEQTHELIKSHYETDWSFLNIHLQPLTDIYLGSAAYPDDLNSPIRSGSRFSVQALSIVAVLILAICGFNYANLSAALAFRQGKEVGIKKVLGANNRSIRLQLFTDSLVVNVLALLLSVIWIWLAQVSFLTGELLPISLDAALLLQYLLPVIGLGLGFAWIMSLYPASLLTRVKSLSAIKGRFQSGKGATNTRRAMVAIQFCISLALFSSALIIRDQLRYIADQELGIDKESLLTIKMLPTDMERYYLALKTALEQSPHIGKVSRSERLVGDPWPINSITLLGSDEAEAKPVNGNFVDIDFLETLGVRMKSGRSFSPLYPADSTNSIIINQATADLLGLTEPLGKEVAFFSQNGPRRIIGVMEDFHFSTLRETIGPMVMIMPFTDLEYITLSITAGDLTEKVEAIRQAWKEVTPDLPLDLRFMDNRLAQLYQSEQNLGALISIFSGLAVVLACLGLYGLISFSIGSRSKEISIRKVIGAGWQSLITLLSWEYVVLLLAGALLAIPLTYYTLNSWLNGFAYHINITASHFLLSLVLFSLLCMFTISQQIAKAIFQNPVKNLRED